MTYKVGTFEFPLNIWPSTEIISVPERSLCIKINDNKKGILVKHENMI